MMMTSQDLAKKIDRQPVGSHPEYSVIAAEKFFLFFFFLWVMDIMRSENCPLGNVEACLENRVSEKRDNSLPYATPVETWYST